MKEKEKAVRISITVPWELHEKMKPLKEKLKNSFNYSHIFQDAVRKAIERQKSFEKRLKEDPSTSKIIERLKREKAESEEDWFGKGKNDGLEWAKRAHYEELQIVIHRPLHSRNIMPLQELGQFNPGFMSYLSDCVRRITAEVGEKPAGRISKYKEAARKSWEAGWMQGVRDFWQEMAAEVTGKPWGPPPVPKQSER